MLKSVSTFEIVERRNRSMWKMFESIRIIFKQPGRERGDGRCQWNAETNAQSIQFVRQGTFPTDETGTTAAVDAPTDETVESRISENEVARSAHRTA